MQRYRLFSDIIELYKMTGPNQLIYWTGRSYSFNLRHYEVLRREQYLCNNEFP